MRGLIVSREQGEATRSFRKNVWIGIIALYGVCLFWLAFMYGQTPSAQAQTIDPTPTATPTRPLLPLACTSKTAPRPLGPRAWVFVMNFQVPNTGCVLVFDRTRDNLFVGYQVVPGCSTYGDVTIINGKADFNGGYIRCSVNLSQTVNSIVGATVLTESAQYRYFYMYARGWLTNSVPITNVNILTGMLSSPVVGYAPVMTSYSPIWMNLPIIGSTVITPELLTHGLLTSHFNDTTFVQSICNFTTGPREQGWSFIYRDGLLRHWQNGIALCDFTGVPLVDFWQDGGEFFIGGSPERSTFTGILEEVLVDPAGSGRPPVFPDANFDVLMPVMGRE